MTRISLQMNMPIRRKIRCLSSLTFLLMIAILVSFFAVAQYFVIVLHKRVQTLHTFQILGARKQDLHRMCLWEALLQVLRQFSLVLHLGVVLPP